MIHICEQENQKKYKWLIHTVKDGLLTNFRVQNKTIRFFFAYLICKDEKVKKSGVETCITDSLCFTAETNNTVSQLYSNNLFFIKIPLWGLR